MGKWVDDITGFHCVIGHTENNIFKHISRLFYLVFDSYMASLIVLTCIFKATTHNRYFSFAASVFS